MYKLGEKERRLKIRNVLHSGEVVRFHNHVGIDKQKCSEHQWGVALLVEHIYPACSKPLLLAALTHDAAEYKTGDIPLPVKHENPELVELLKGLERRWEEKNGVAFDLHPDEYLALKIADTLEGMWYCILQVRMGHQDAKRPFRKWRVVFSEYYDTKESRDLFPKARGVFDDLNREMEEL